MTLVKINAADYDLEESKAQEISDMFKPMLDKMVELEKEFNDIQKMEMSAAKCARSRILRLEYVKVRTGTGKIHKTLKVNVLKFGRFIDGWKHTQGLASQGKEEILLNDENHFENIEKEKQAALGSEREAKALKYMDEGLLPPNLGSLNQTVYEGWIASQKLAYETRLKMEKKAEEDRIAEEKRVEAERIAKEKAEQAERERINKENEALKAEREEREKQAQAEAAAREKEEAARLEKERIEREKQEAILKAEREEREKAQAELKAKEEEEYKKKLQEDADKQTELKKGDVDKVNDLIVDLGNLKTKYSFKSKKNIKMYADVSMLIDKVLNHISK